MKTSADQNKKVTAPQWLALIKSLLRFPLTILKLGHQLSLVNHHLANLNSKIKDIETSIKKTTHSLEDRLAKIEQRSLAIDQVLQTSKSAIVTINSDAAVARKASAQIASLTEKTVNRLQIAISNATPPPAKISAPDSFPPLIEKIFSESDLGFMDIGSRWGPKELLFAARKHMTLLVCDADPSALQEINSKPELTSMWKKTHLVPFGVGPSGRVDLHLTQQPGLSSFLPPNTSEIPFYTDRPEEFNVVNRVPIECLTLDEIAKRHPHTPFTVIKTDTQGTEIDIFKSGHELLRHQTLGIFTELTQFPFYQGMTKPDRLITFLDEAGFELIDLKRVNSRLNTGHSLPYSKKQLAWSHAVFLKRPTHLDRNDSLSFRKLFCVAILFEFLDFAYLLLKNYPQHFEETENLKTELARWSQSYAEIFKNELDANDLRSISDRFLSKDRQKER